MHTKLLTSNEAIGLDIVSYPNGEKPAETEWRGTSWDSKVGEIHTVSGKVDSRKYNIKPREIVWLVSKENYKLPTNVTGITTLKTGLTRKGVLTLTVGILDPGYEGPLSTAIINFSSSEISIEEGDTFFRNIFFQHAKAKDCGYKISREHYISDVSKGTIGFSDTFLDIKKISNEIISQFFKTEWIIVNATAIALLLATIGLIATPLATSAFRHGELLSRIAVLENELNHLKTSIPVEPTFPDAASDDIVSPTDLDENYPPEDETGQNEPDE